MRFRQAALILVSFVAHGSLALKGEPALRRGSLIRGLQVMKGETTEGNMAQKGTGTTKATGNFVPKGPGAAEEPGTMPNAPKDNGSLAVVPPTDDEGTAEADGLPGGPKGDSASASPPPPKDDKEKKDKKEKSQKCKKPKAEKRRRTQVDKAEKGASGAETVPKAPKTTDKASPAMEPVMEPETLPESTPEDQTSNVDPDFDDGERFCLQSVLSEEQCAAVQNGELPTDDKTTKGIITMELSYTSDSKEALQMVSEIMKSETPSKFIGCSQSFRNLQEEEEGDELVETEKEVEEEYLYVSGLKFGDFTVTNDACENVAEDVNCNKIESEIDIFYNGKDASQEEKEEMFALLEDVIQTQEESGSFAGAGSIQMVEATSMEASSDRSPSVGLAVGVAVAAFVLAVAGCCFYKSRKRTLVVNGRRGASDKQDHHNTDDSSAE